jgi:hypothetical protein
LAEAAVATEAMRRAANFMLFGFAVVLLIGDNYRADRRIKLRSVFEEWEVDDEDLGLAVGLF